MAERTYQDKFTLDGRLRPQAGVTKAKVSAAKGLLEKSLKGDIMSDARLREAITSSDAIFNFAFLTNLNFIPQFDEAPRVWSSLAGTRSVEDFDRVYLYSIFGNGLTGNGITANGGAAIVPEATPYPHATVTGREAAYASIAKHGLQIDWTWEARLRDSVGFFGSLPSELTEVALKTEEEEVFDALIQGVAAAGGASTIDGGVLPDETTVLPNPKLTPNAIWQAIRELSNREINGRKVNRVSGYNVVVPVGVGDFINFQLNQTILQVQNGAITYSGGNQGALNGVTIIESDRLSGNEWYILPKPGTLRRPVLELARLRGYETPELRIENAAGNYVGGASVAPFEGSFSTDVIAMRLRYPVGGILWDSTYVGYSNGTGVA